MCERAAELGHSLLFPAICRYCGRQIYLFATPEGGFAIFDDVGGDWPKHECWGVDQSTTRYSDLAPTFSREFAFPVPADAQHRSPAAGSHIVGTVLRQTRVSPRSNLWESWLFDGKTVLLLTMPDDTYIGRCVRGLVQIRDGIAALTAIEVLSPPELTASGQPRRPGPTEFSQLHASDIWPLQALANSLAGGSPATAETLSRALDAFLNGYTLTGVFLVARLLLAAPIPTTVKAKLVRLTVLGLIDLKLHTSVPAFAARLSGGTIAALDPDARRAMEHAERLAALQKKHMTTERLREIFDRRLAKELRYFQRVNAGDLLAFKQFWQAG